MPCVPTCPLWALGCFCPLILWQREYTFSPCFQLCICRCTPRSGLPGLRGVLVLVWHTVFHSDCTICIPNSKGSHFSIPFPKFVILGGFFSVLRIEPRASGMLVKGCTTWATVLLFLYFVFEVSSHLLRLGWPQTQDPPAFTSQETGIRGRRHCPWLHLSILMEYA
jgi:hypothetical protein